MRIYPNYLCPQIHQSSKKMTKEEILYHAEHAKHYTELLIKQCDSWLSEEEGMKNMEAKIREKKKRHQTEKF